MPLLGQRAFLGGLFSCNTARGVIIVALCFHFHLHHTIRGTKQRSCLFWVIIITKHVPTSPLSYSAAAIFLFFSRANLCQSWKCRSFKKKIEESGNEPKFRGGLFVPGNGIAQPSVNGGGGGKFVNQLRFCFSGRVTTPVLFRDLPTPYMHTFYRYWTAPSG